MTVLGALQSFTHAECLLLGNSTLHLCLAPKFPGCHQPLSPAQSGLHLSGGGGQWGRGSRTEAAVRTRRKETETRPRNRSPSPLPWRPPCGPRRQGAWGTHRGPACCVAGEGGGGGESKPQAPGGPGWTPAGLRSGPWTGLEAAPAACLLVAGAACACPRLRVRFPPGTDSVRLPARTLRWEGRSQRAAPTGASDPPEGHCPGPPRLGHKSGGRGGIF